jgi:hypothetical protein
MVVKERVSNNVSFDVQDDKGRTYIVSLEERADGWRVCTFGYDIPVDIMLAVAPYIKKYLQIPEEVQ